MEYKQSEEKRKYVREQMRKYRATHPEYKEKERLKALEYTKKYPDRRKASTKKWRESNKDKWNAYMQIWRKNNPERWKELSKEYRDRNIDVIRVKEAQKETRRRKATGSFTLEEWNAKKKLFNHTCPSCGKKEGEIKLTIDHAVPLIAGGTHNIDNLQPLCAHCNFSKREKTIIYKPL